MEPVITIGNAQQEEVNFFSYISSMLSNYALLEKSCPTALTEPLHLLDG